MGAITFTLPLTDRMIARAIAQTIVRNGFDPRATIAELRPERKSGHSEVFQRLMAEPLVQSELRRVLEVNGSSRNAKKFVEKLWEHFENEGTEVDVQGQKVRILDKASLELKVTAMRLLAKGYISEKKTNDKDEKPFTIGGLDSSAVKALTGSAPMLAEDEEVESEGKPN